MPSRALRPVPDQPPRALGLVRVSKDRDGTTISPTTQRVAISDYAAGRGYEVVDWLEGIDESGSRARSAWWPRLDQAVSAVESGVYDVIVVWEFSRAARHRLRWASAIDRVESAGGRLESATERVDVTTASGRFQRGVLSEMHAYRAEAIGEGWKNAHANRIRNGRPATGKPRWGYRYDKAQKLHVPNEATGPVLADLYGRYVAGESVYSLVRWLNGHGWRTIEDGLWSDRTLRRVLDSGFAAGLFAANGQLHPGMHEPLIGEDLWQAYLDARHTRRARPARVERSQYLLSGMVRCARCGGAMVAGQYGVGRAPKYRCKAGKESGPEVCAGGYVMARLVEQAVFDEVSRVAAVVEEQADAATAMSARRARAVADQDRLVREQVRLEQALARLAVQNARDPLPESVYREARGELEQQLGRLQEAVEDAARTTRAAAADPGRVAAGLVEAWDEWPLAQRRETLRQLVRVVVVRTGRPRADVRVKMVWEDDD